MSEIDVLAGIRNKKMVAYGASASGSAALGADAAMIMGYKKSGVYNEYQKKEISGEVVYTGRKGLGVNLGGSQYQKQISSKAGYTKKISETNGNISGIEINVNPMTSKKEVYYQKMPGISGAIGEGHYQIINSKQVINEQNLGGNVNVKKMKVVSRTTNVNEPENIGHNQSYRKQIIITSKNENNISQNSGNGESGMVIINNSRTATGVRRNSGNSKYSVNSKRSAKSGNGELSQQISSGQVVFNSRLKTDKGQNSTYSTHSVKEPRNIISTRTEYEKNVISKGDRSNEQITTETRKVTEIKKYNTKTKNVESLRDYGNKNGF